MIGLKDNEKTFGICENVSIKRLMSLSGDISVTRIANVNH